MGSPVPPWPPAKPGEVRNPKGINQYTYRRRAEEALEAWCRENGESGRSNAEELIRHACEQAQSKRGAYALKLILDRVLPATTKVEATFPEGVPTTARKPRANGVDRAEKVAELVTARDADGEALH